MIRIDLIVTMGSYYFDDKAHDVLSMRDALDPKRFYKKLDKCKKYQIGTIVDDHRDFYDRIPNRERKQTLVEQLLDDMNVKQKIKKRYKKAVKELPYYNKLKRKNKARAAAKEGKSNQLKDKRGKFKRKYKRNDKPHKSGKRR